MPVRPHPDAPDDSLLFGADDAPLARMRLRDDDGTRVAADVRALLREVRGGEATAVKPSASNRQKATADR